MITSVDTSTLIKLIVDEEGSDRAEVIWQSADSVASVSLVVVEARAARAAAARVNRLWADRLGVATTELVAFVDDLHLAEVTEELVDNAAHTPQVRECVAGPYGLRLPTRTSQIGRVAGVPEALVDGGHTLPTRATGRQKR